MVPKIKEFVANGNLAHFSSLQDGVAVYTVAAEGQTYSFPIPLPDLMDATINSCEKAMMLMRYIRKAIDANQLVETQSTNPILAGKDDAQFEYYRAGNVYYKVLTSTGLYIFPISVAENPKAFQNVESIKELATYIKEAADAGTFVKAC